MIPTLEINDRVLVAKFWNWFFPPSRGSLYVFRYPIDQERDFVKRVIAIPGDTVNIVNGVVYINGKPTNEPYVKRPDRFTLRANSIFPEVPFTVPEGKYFMLGDNRGNSQDSRYWGFVSKKNIKAKAFVVYFSFDNADGSFSFGNPFSWFKIPFQIRWTRIGKIIHMIGE